MVKKKIKEQKRGKIHVFNEKFIHSVKIFHELGIELSSLKLKKNLYGHPPQ